MLGNWWDRSFCTALTCKSVRTSPLEMVLRSPSVRSSPLIQYGVGATGWSLSPVHRNNCNGSRMFYSASIL